MCVYVGRSTLVFKSKITITKTHQTDHDCGECISEVEENLQSKQTFKAGNKSQEKLNMLEILLQHCIMKIRTAIKNGETVTSSNETNKKGCKVRQNQSAQGKIKVSANQSARQRLLKDMDDMLLKVRFLEGKCFPEGFATKFEKHKLNLKLDRVQKFEQAFRKLKVSLILKNHMRLHIESGKCIEAKSKTVDPFP